MNYVKQIRAETIKRFL